MAGCVVESLAQITFGKEGLLDLYDLPLKRCAPASEDVEVAHANHERRTHPGSEIGVDRGFDRASKMKMKAQCTFLMTKDTIYT